MPKIKRESRQFIVINEEKLITEVQNRPILYDKALKGYRKPAIREGAWLEVANSVQSTVDECKKRWRSLRDAFMKQYKQYQRDDQSVKKKWIFYEQMEFLAPFFDNSINGMRFDLDDDFIETVAGDIDGTTEVVQVQNQVQDSQICKLTVSRPSIVAIPLHQTQTEYQPHHIEIDEFEEDLEDDEDPNNMITKQLITHPKKEMNQNSTETQIYSQVYTTTAATMEELHQHASSQNQKTIQSYNNDSDERFLLSCIPIFQRLTNKKNALARLKIQQLLYEIEFDANDNGGNNS